MTMTMTFAEGSGPVNDGVHILDVELEGVGLSFFL